MDAIRAREGPTARASAGACTDPAGGSKSALQDVTAPAPKNLYMRSIHGARHSGAGNGLDQYATSLAIFPSRIEKMNTAW